MMKIIVVSALLVSMVLAEPPAPRGRFASAAQTSYLPPNRRTSGPPANSYVPPSSSYGVPSTNYGAPSDTYGPPTQGFNTQNDAPSTNYGPPSNTYGVPEQNGGYEQEAPAKYEFEYKVLDYPSGNDFGHKEERDGSVTTGRYYVLLPDGRKQIVTYVADENGYRPTITYEEASNGQNGYNNNAQSGYNNNAQSGYNNNAQAFQGY
jgi:hypothetical protein